MENGEATVSGTVIALPHESLAPGTINPDEAILAQEKQIEKEIAEMTPLIGGLCPLEQLINEYSNDDKVYQQKLQDLLKKYKSLRKTRPDGNCFFRAVSFAYFELLQSNQEELERFYSFAEKSKEELVQLGMPMFTIEDFHDTFMEVLSKIKSKIDLKELIELFNDQSFSDYIVVYMRLLTSGYLQQQELFFQCFIEGDRTIKEFCHQEVEPMYRESDHIHIIALTMSLGIGVRVQYMDRGEGVNVNAHDFPEDTIPLVHLLYRPGHYDILYP